MGSAVIAVILVILNRPISSHAAQINTNSSELCAFSLHGPVVSGDRDRLSTLLDASRLDEFDQRTVSICLDSLGGSFDEGIAVSELVYDRGLSTVVADGAECYSACAFIFMAGVSANRAGPARMLSAGAILGFHAPYFSLSDGRYSREQVEDTSREMRKATVALLKLSSKRTLLGGTDFLKKSLITRIFENGPKEIFVVKTIAEAARWDIIVYDAPEKEKWLDKGEGMKNLCTNLHLSNMDESISSPMNLSVRVESYSSKYHAEEFRILVYDSRTNDTVCEVYPRTMKGSQKIYFFACSYDYWSSKSFGDCREYKTRALFGQSVPDFFVLSPDTKLKRFN